jgi:hypothetical protein
MPISFGETSGGGGAYVRVNMPQNRWTLKSDGSDTPIDMSRGLAIDVKNVRFGWMLIDIGRRDWQPWPSVTERTAKPSDEYKQGFEVECCTSDGVRAEFSGNSYGQGQFIAKLYNAAEKSPEFAAGKVPVVCVTSSTPVAVGKGTSYDMGFTISKWISRPADGAPAAPAQPAAAPSASTRISKEELDAFGF